MTDGPIETPGPEGTEALSGPAEETVEYDGHPAWQPILDALPDEALRTLVTPHLQEWDRGVQDRFQSLHSEYEPWREVIDNTSPEFVAQALGLVQQIEENPQYVYDKLAEAYGLGQGTLEPTEESATIEVGGVEYDANDPLLRKVTELEGVLGGLQQFLQGQQEEQEEQDSIAEYDDYMAQLRSQMPGPYDEDVIDSMVANGVDPQEAISRYQNSVKNAAQALTSPGSTAPRVMGANAGGSGLPSGQINPAQLNSQDTRKLVEAIILREQGQAT